MNSPLFYISTPLFYTNASPHLGHLYSTLYADFISRYKKERKYKVYFVTGADQHGEKIWKKAQIQNQSVTDFVEKQTQSFLKLWKKANIQFTHFAETHNKIHQEFVQKNFLELKKQNHLYLNRYQGQYCANCENFQIKTVTKEKNLQYCPQCDNLLRSLSEENYFLKISPDNKKEIKELINNWKTKNPTSTFTNQLKDLFKNPNWDLSISRKKHPWGIVIDAKHEQSTYVWFDALLGYISVLSPSEQREIWQNPETEIVQIIGKEIMKFHLIYWPIFLKFLNYRQPDIFVVHGWILQDKIKMSKSLGNIIDPIHLIDQYDADVIRLYLASLMNPHLDITYREKDLTNFYNSFIVNNLSNFYYRVLSMYQKYQTPIWNIKTNEKNLFLKAEKRFLKEKITRYHETWKQFQIAETVKVLFSLIDHGNQIINQNKPWSLYRDNKILELTAILYSLFVILKIIADFLKPFTPKLAKKIYETLVNIQEIKKMYNINLNIPENFKLNKFDHLYERK